MVKRILRSIRSRVHGVLIKLSPTLAITEIFPDIESEFEPIRSYLKGKLLNAGAGNRDIRTMVEGEVVNQDLATGMHNDNIDIHSPLHDIPVEDAHFDVILCNAVLEHVANPAEVLTEFARVAKPSGTLILTVPFMQPEHLDPTDYQRYTMDGLCRLVRQHGFQVVEAHGQHSVYSTLAWITVEWLGSLKGFRQFFLKWLLYPWLRSKCRKSRHHVHTLASAYRLVAHRVPMPADDVDWLDHLPREWNRTRRSVPGMTTPYELCMLESYAQRAYSGKGKIVDLGCWFGATAVALARGLGRNKLVASETAVDAYDCFIWESWMDSVVDAAGLKVPRKYQPGDDFFADASEYVKTYHEGIRMHQADLMCPEAAPNVPIEFLFVDAMKSWELANAIIKYFFVSLMEGRGIMVHQDFTYFHHITATNHLTQWRLKECFEIIYDVPRSCSVVFRCLKAPDPKSLVEFTPDSFSLEEIKEAYDYFRARLLPESQGNLHLCELAFLTERRLGEAALRKAEYCVDSRLVSDEFRGVLSEQLDTWKDDSSEEWVVQLKDLCGLRGE